VKIAVASDLHLEFGDLEIDNDGRADVLILSGDILVAKDIAQRDPYGVMGPEYRSNRYHDFMQRCSALFPHVIYVLGNHEHYNGDFAKTETHLKDVLGYLKNVYVLEKEIKVIDDVTFIGGTLWTDMNNGDTLTLYHMKSMMNDFRVVDNSNRVVNYKAYEQINGVDNREKPIFKTRTAKFQPEDAFEEHANMKGYIRQIVEGKHDQKFVVVGHHSPSKQSTHPMYADDTIMNGGYSSDMDEFITDHPQIKLWTHGHTHHPFDYIVGETRVVCNPRGYINYEPQASNFKLLTVEV
jgi:hypothetical protein